MLVHPSKCTGVNHERLRNRLSRHAGSFAMRLSYGFEDTQAEKYIEMTLEAVNISDTGSSPVAVMINIFPSRELCKLFDQVATSTRPQFYQ